MKVLATLGAAEGKQMWDYCRALPLETTTHSSYAPNRKEVWRRLGSNLQSVTHGRAKVFRYPAAPDFLESIGSKHLPGWNSILICGGPTSISWHRDHSHFHGPAVMINLGTAVYREMKNRHAKDVRDPAGVTEATLLDGQVVLIDTKMLHSSQQMSTERFNLTFRTIKEEYASVIHEASK
jgi:hypothetical protein